MLLAGTGPGGGAATRRALTFSWGYKQPGARPGLVPITCEVQNDGPPFNAIIEVSADQLGRAKPAA